MGFPDPTAPPEPLHTYRWKDQYTGVFIDITPRSHLPPPYGPLPWCYRNPFWAAFLGAVGTIMLVIIFGAIA